jgi:hypothetical protein
MEGAKDVRKDLKPTESMQIIGTTIELTIRLQTA